MAKTQMQLANRARKEGKADANWYVAEELTYWTN